MRDKELIRRVKYTFEFSHFMWDGGGGREICIALQMTFVSATIKIRIVLCLPCVFIARANWHSPGVL